MNEILQEEADEISVEQGQRFVPAIMLSNSIGNKNKPKKSKRKRK
jgi:hypothetical protein